MREVEHLFLTNFIVHLLQIGGFTNIIKRALSFVLITSLLLYVDYETSQNLGLKAGLQKERQKQRSSVPWFIPQVASRAKAEQI